MKTVRTIGLLLLIPAIGRAAEFKATVAAGSHHRQAAPVSIDVELPDAMHDAPACVTAAGKTLPAQVEPVGSGKARIWWIVPDLPAGKTQSCTVKVGPDAAKPSASFAWKGSSHDGLKCVDLLFADRPVLRYMHTPYDRKDIERTKKPFHHVFDPNGSRTITQGVGSTTGKGGGRFPHHRGIFFGYNKCKFRGRSYDTWHANKGEHELHEEFARQIAGPVLGGHVLTIHWNAGLNKPFAVETRRAVAFRQPAGKLLLEFTSTLRPTRGPVRLEGDRQHAGFQFRAASEVAENEKATRYLRPAKWSNLPPNEQINTPEHKDLPWNAVQYPLGDRSYTVAYLTDPANPDNAEFSERLYGRFGEYFTWDLAEDNPLTCRYRFWISADGSVTREQIANKYQDLADPPKVTLNK